jgi:hypothetical protein
MVINGYNDGSNNPDKLGYINVNCNCSLETYIIGILLIFHVYNEFHTWGILESLYKPLTIPGSTR